MWLRLYIQMYARCQKLGVCMCSVGGLEACVGPAQNQRLLRLPQCARQALRRPGVWDGPGVDLTARTCGKVC